MSGVSSERRPAPAATSSPLADIVIQLLGREKGHPLRYKQLRRDIARQIENQPDGVVRSALDHLVERDIVIDIGDGEYFLADNLAAAERRICEVVAAYHATFPYEGGMPAAEIKKRFSRGKTLNARRNIDPRLFDLAMSRCRQDGRIRDHDDGVRLEAFQPTAAQAAEIARLDRAVLDHVGQRRFHVLDLGQMPTDLGIDPRRARSIFGRMLKTGEIMGYGEGRYIEAVALERIKSTLATELSRVGRLTTREIKQLLGIPRNAIIPLLEHLDEAGFLRRDGDLRELAGAP